MKTIFFVAIGVCFFVLVTYFLVKFLKKRKFIQQERIKEEQKCKAEETRIDAFVQNFLVKTELQFVEVAEEVLNAMLLHMEELGDFEFRKKFEINGINLHLEIWQKSLLVHGLWGKLGIKLPRNLYVKASTPQEMIGYLVEIQKFLKSPEDAKDFRVLFSERYQKESV